jgi:hypothetical protein
MPVAVDEPGTRRPPDPAGLVVAPEPLRHGGGDGDGRLPGGGGGRPAGRGSWPLVPALMVIVLLAVLLTFLGMLTQIWANLAGSQLPGA